VTLYENLNSIVEGQKVSRASLRPIFSRKSTDGWRMIHHHGSTVAQAPPDDETPRFH